MPLFDTAAQNASLDNDYGASHGSHSPSTFTLHLYDDDPRDGGSEIIGGGYSAKTVSNNGTNFPPASGGKKTSAALSFGTATDDWPTARWWLLKDSATGDEFECCEFDRRIDVTSGASVSVVLVINYDQEAI